jgi:hypothetical protein
MQRKLSTVLLFSVNFVTLSRVLTRSSGRRICFATLSLGGKKNKPRCLVSELKVLKVDSLSSRTALHVAAAGGHVRCVRLLLAAVSGDGDR